MRAIAIIFVVVIINFRIRAGFDVVGMFVSSPSQIAVIINLCVLIEMMRVISGGVKIGIIVNAFGKFSLIIIINPGIFGLRRCVLWAAIRARIKITEHARPSCPRLHVFPSRLAAWAGVSLLRSCRRVSVAANHGWPTRKTTRRQSCRAAIVTGNRQSATTERSKSALIVRLHRRGKVWIARAVQHCGAVVINIRCRRIAAATIPHAISHLLSGQDSVLRHALQRTFPSSQQPH